MTRSVRYGMFVVALAAVVVVLRFGNAAAPAPSAPMVDAANKFLAALPAELRAQATFTLEDQHRTTWFFIPIARKGVSLKKLDEAQRKLAHNLVKTGLSPGGYTKATQIMELEGVLREIEKDPVKRDPENYFISIFGTPTAGGTWGWRAEGHHVSLNFTVVKGTMLSTTPQFFGANPAEVRVDGPYKGRRVLKTEEDLGRELVTALDDKQRAQAIIDPKAYADMITKSESKVEPLKPDGLAVTAMTAPQKKLLRKLLGEYAASLSPALAKDRLAKVEKAGFDKMNFAWAGGLKRGDGHYYRIQGPTFLIEYDCTQNDANHIHSVWREFDGDFGRDLLREHYKTAHTQ